MTATHYDNAVEKIDRTTAFLMTGAQAQGFAISADLRISELHAAQLLGYTAGHLKNLRQDGKGPQFYHRGVGGSRISYRLTDLAMWVEKGVSNDG